MAKKNVEIPGPEPLPKVGDDVGYAWPGGVEPLKLAGKILPAKVTAVLDGFDGRLVNLDVDSGNGPIPVKSAPWRDDKAGNTWHWPTP